MPVPPVAYALACKKDEFSVSLSSLIRSHSGHTKLKYSAIETHTTSQFDSGELLAKERLTNIIY